jgi:hypothetical protein
MTNAFDQAFLAAIDDLNAGCLHDDPAHYLRAVPAARHAEFGRRLTALMAARGPAGHDEAGADAYDAALSAVAAGTSAGLLPDALRKLRKLRGVERDALIDALAAEYGLGRAGRDALRRSYHTLESGALAGPGIAHRLLRSLARLLDADGDDFIAAARAVVRRGPALQAAPVMGRSAGGARPPHATATATVEGSRRAGRAHPDVELVERLFTGGPDA